MKCEICNKEIIKGEGYYLTPAGAICAKCYKASGMKVQMGNTAAKSHKKSDAQKHGLSGYPDMVAARS